MSQVLGEVGIKTVCKLCHAFLEYRCPCQVLDDNTIDKHHISDALKDMRQQMDSQLNRLRVEAGDIELQRRHHIVSEQLQENKVTAMQLIAI